MACASTSTSKLSIVTHSGVQVQMGALPVGRAAALHPPKPPSISERIARDPGRNVRANIEGDKQGSNG